MVKEQEELERLEKLKKAKILYGDSLGITIEGFRSLQRDLGVVLNSIKEKDKEIQFQKDINKQEKDRHKQAEKSLKGQIKKLKEILATQLAKGLNDSIKAQQKADTDLEDLDKGWQVEIEKKDKMIDLMAEDWYKAEGYKNQLYEGESEITRYKIKKEILIEQYKKHYERKAENES